MRRSLARSWRFAYMAMRGSSGAGLAALVLGLCSRSKTSFSSSSRTRFSRSSIVARASINSWMLARPWRLHAVCAHERAPSSMPRSLARGHQSRFSLRAPASCPDNSAAASRSRSISASRSERSHMMRPHCTVSPRRRMLCCFSQSIASSTLSVHK